MKTADIFLIIKNIINYKRKGNTKFNKKVTFKVHMYINYIIIFSKNKIIKMFIVKILCIHKIIHIILKFYYRI